MNKTSSYQVHGGTQCFSHWHFVRHLTWHYSLPPSPAPSSSPSLPSPTQYSTNFLLSDSSFLVPSGPPPPPLLPLGFQPPQTLLVHPALILGAQARISNYPLDSWSVHHPVPQTQHAPNWTSPLSLLFLLPCDLSEGGTTVHPHAGQVP